MTLERLTPVFAVVFALVYVVSEQWNIALVTYHPRPGTWDLWTQAPRNGPAMYWYGWIGTSLIGACLACALVAPFRSLRLPSWVGWAVPAAVMVAFVYLLRAFFLR